MANTSDGSAYAVSQARKLSENRLARKRSRLSMQTARVKMSADDKRHMATTLTELAKSSGLSLRDCGTLDFCRRPTVQ